LTLPWRDRTAIHSFDVTTMPAINQHLSQTRAGGPFGGFVSAWRDRRLVLRLAAREIAARYRGSLLGALWLVLLPLMMLAVYTFAFGVIFRARWTGADGAVTDTPAFALILFAGLSIYSIFSETVNRAPSLVLENPSYVKKVVFPLELLAWVALLVSLFNFAVSMLIFALFYPFVFGVPPLSVLWLPLTIAPLALITLGLSWFLASLGVFLRDIRPVVGVLTMAMLFLSPVFYPLDAAPESARWLLALNPMAPILEQARALLFWGEAPNPMSLAVQYAIGVAVAVLGYLWFAKTRRAFADVL